METIIAPVVIAVLTVIGYTLYKSRKEKSISKVIYAHNEDEAVELFFNKMKNEFPKDYIEVSKTHLGSFEVTIKTIKK